MRLKDGRGRPAQWQWMAGLATIVVSMSCAHAIVNSGTASSPGTGVLNGEGKLTINRTDGSFICSGSLLSGGSYVLTAAHCVTGASGSATTNSIALSFMGGATTSSSATYYVQPGWNGTLGAGNDLALVQLNVPISSITGYTLYTPSAQGSQVLVAGYGNTGTGESGYTANTFGTLRYGYNEFDASAGFYGGSGISSSVYLYDFDDGLPPRSLFGSRGLGANEALIAPGDSGGGSFVLVNDVWQLAGVHSFIGCVGVGCTPQSRFGDYAGDVSLYANRTWLDSYLVAQPVPEPETYAMMLAGLGLLGLVARRRKAQAAQPAHRPA